MKRLFVLFVAFLFVSCGAGYSVVNTEIPPIEKGFSFNKEKKELFILSNFWLDKKYKGVQPSIQERNMELGEIIGKVYIGSLRYSSSSSYSSNYDVPDQPVNVVVDLDIEDKSVRMTVKPQPFSIVDSKFHTVRGLVNEEKIKEEVAKLFSNFENFIKENKVVMTSDAPKERILALEGEKNDLYIRANKWMVENFIDAKSVIQFSDKEGGVVTGKYLLGEYTLIKGSPEKEKKDVFALITIDLKDKAAKISIVPQSFLYIANSQIAKEGLNKQSVDLKISALITSFEEYMRNQTSTF